MKIVCLIFFSLFVVLSCSNVKDLQFSKENKDQVLDKVKKSKDLTGEEVGLLTAALMRTSFTKESLEGKTVGQLLDEQRKIMAEMEAKEREAKRLAEEAAKKEAQIALELSNHIMVAPYEKSFQKADYRNS